MDLQHMKFQILCLGLIILAAYIGGKIARKLKIGEVIGQIFGGILVGPHFLILMKRLFSRFYNLENIALFNPVYHFFNNGLEEYSRIFEDYHFFVFLFLGIIAFSLGEELHRDRIKKVGLKAIYICFLQALLTWILISAGFHFIFQFTWINSLLIGSIGIATAPALIFILMNKLKIEGSLRSILANIVVLDDIIEVIFFSVFLSIAVSIKKGGEISFFHITSHLFWEFFFAILIGTIIFLALKFTLKPKLSEEEDNDSDESFIVALLSKHSTPSVEVLLIIIGIISIGLSIAINFELPFLITAVVAGFLISNFHSHAIFDSLKIGNVMPIFNLLFFGIIGSSVRLETFSIDSLLFIIGYIVLRSTGKLAGNYIGCRITNQDPKITACLPKLMLPQAGMAAVETILVLSVLKGSGGEQIFNTIIPALVIFELGGAYLSEKTLIKWKTWITGERDAMKSDDKIKGAGQEFVRLVKNRAIPMHATTKEQAVFELSRLIAAEKGIKDISIITNPILEREKLSSTSAGKGIAFPHCRSEFVDDVMIVCGVLDNIIIDWDAIDKIPIDLLFLIVSPKDQPEKHLQALRTISTLIGKQNMASDLRTAIRENTFETFQKQLVY
jgi:mannitol/fructose-specific phosphotransferase system IIA component (Ntr-type)/NhaP-type Na+/H+ or K+/H+ antiporter